MKMDLQKGLYQYMYFVNNSMYRSELIIIFFITLRWLLYEQNRGLLRLSPPGVPLLRAVCRRTALWPGVCSAESLYGSKNRDLFIDYINSNWWERERERDREKIWLKYCRYGVKHYPINQSTMIKWMYESQVLLISKYTSVYLALENIVHVQLIWRGWDARFC